MKYKIDKGEGPAYLQLYRQLRDDIIDGAYQFGARLPSKRSLSDDSGTSTVTVEHTYALLCDEGYVEAREKSGYFVVFRSVDGFAAPTERRAASNNPPPSSERPAFPFSVMAKTLRAVLTDRGEAVLERSPNAGRDELREALRLYLARNRGIRVEKEQIVIGAGAEYLYGLIIELLGRGRVYGIESPSYEKIERVYMAAEAKCEYLPLAHDGIDSKALSATAADVLHTTPYRSFPSGVTASASKRHEYIRWAEAGERFIIEDDFESEFAVFRKPEDTLYSLSKKGNVIYLNTFSKTISPSLRVGYAVMPKRLADVFYEKLGFYSCTVSTYEQLVLAALIENGDFERHINRVRRELRKAASRPKP
ncbi:MAG: PLP-dependent aminotransferase family protein [Clostridia bacterium]|nr:PLP-dependent aminotransferase family protein [Clostridia bacterium]